MKVTSKMQSCSGNRTLHKCGFSVLISYVAYFSSPWEKSVFPYGEYDLQGRPSDAGLYQTMQARNKCQEVWKREGRAVFLMVPELHGCSVTRISSLGLTPKTDEVKGSKRIILCMQTV